MISLLTITTHHNNEYSTTATAAIIVTEDGYDITVSLFAHTSQTSQANHDYRNSIRGVMEGLYSNAHLAPSTPLLQHSPYEPPPPYAEAAPLDGESSPPDEDLPPPYEGRTFNEADYPYEGELWSDVSGFDPKGFDPSNFGALPHNRYMYAPPEDSRGPWTPYSSSGHRSGSLASQPQINLLLCLVGGALLLHWMLGPPPVC